MKSLAAFNITMGFGLMLQSHDPSQSAGVQIACWIFGNTILFIGVRATMDLIGGKKP